MREAECDQLEADLHAGYIPHVISSYKLKPPPLRFICKLRLKLFGLGRLKIMFLI
jgi:hypothetical protein